MKEHEIRKKNIYKKLLQLTKLDALRLSKKCVEKIKCYSCNKILIDSFVKSGFKYSECKMCRGLFANPRPSQNVINDFYRNSKTSKYFDIFYKSNLKNRIIKIWKPKTKIITDFLLKENIKKSNIIDLGAGYGTFCNLMDKNKKFNVVAVEPSALLSNNLKKKKIKTINKFSEDLIKSDLPAGKNIFVSFELIEHLQNPSKFFKKLSKVAKNGDYFIFTTLSGAGLDIRELWENSNAICPPQHLNFFNPYSIKIFMEKNGYKVLKIDTPGKLDISILENNFKKIKSDFLKIFLKYSSKKEKTEFQNFLIKTKTSSHMMVFSQINKL